MVGRLAWVVALGTISIAADVLADTKPPPPATSQAAVEKLVRDNIIEVGKASKGDLGFASDPMVTMPGGDPSDGKGVGEVYWGQMLAAIAHKPEKIAAIVDDARGIAWFQVPFEAHLTATKQFTGGTHLTIYKHKASGVAIRSGTAWKIAGIGYGWRVSDAELFKRADQSIPKGPPALTGDAKLAKTVAGWFATGFASQVAKATVIASGTAPGEFQTGPGTDKIVKVWDGLKLAPTEIDTRTFANGQVGFVRAVVMLPAKKAGAATQMILSAVVVNEAGSWKWVSLSYTTSWMP